MPVCGDPPMSGRILNSTLLLSLSSFPALGLLLTYVVGPFAGGGWAALLVVSTIASALVVVLAGRRGWSAILSPEHAADVTAAAADPAGRATWIWWLAAVLALVPLTIAIVASPRVQISHHGFFHSAYVYEVIAGHVPPENVTLPGHPSNTYWPYHALLAALVTLFAAPAPLASAALNLVLLAASVAWSAGIVRELYGPPRHGTGALVAMFGLLGANLFGVVHWILYAAAGVPLDPRTMVLMGDVRLATLVAKFANYTGAALGVYFYLFVVLVVVRMVRGRVRGFDLVLAFMALLGSFALHAITGAFIVAGFPPALACAVLVAAWLDGRLATFSPRALLRWAQTRLGGPGAPALIPIGVIAMALLGWPVFHFMANATSEFPEPPRFGWPDAYALSVVAVSYPLLPFFVIGIVRALRVRDARLLFLALVCLGGYALASVFSISGRNEYKFIYLGSIGLCLVALEPITRLLRAPATRSRLARGVAWAALLLPLVNVALFGIAQLRSPLFADKTFSYDGRHVTAAVRPYMTPGTGIEYADLFTWVRANTPLDTVIVVPLILRDGSVLYVLSERVPYIIDGLHYNRGLPDYAPRAAQVEAVYGGHASAAERAEALHEIGQALPGRPLVLVYPKNLTARFDPTSAGLQRVRQGAAADLYVFPERFPQGAAS